MFDFVAGFLYDITGSYAASFYAAGAMMIISALLCCCLRSVSVWHKKKTYRQQKSKHFEID